MHRITPRRAALAVVWLPRYFRALRRAQRAIDLEDERYKHFWLREMPDDLTKTRSWLDGRAARQRTWGARAKRPSRLPLRRSVAAPSFPRPKAHSTVRNTP